jgi:hypothetical protein
VRSIVKSLFVCTALIAATAGTAFAQDTVGAGVSFYDDEIETGVGFNLDYGKAVIDRDQAAFAVVGEFGLNRFEEATATSYLGGVRVQGKLANRVLPYGQFLIGAEHCCESTNLALQPGFGVDVAINPYLNVRAQVDFRNVRYEDDINETYQRYTVGISIPVGRR